MTFMALVFSCNQKPLAVEEGFLNINGSQVFYKKVGEGEPLIIIHGGPVLDHSYLLPHIESLGRDYQLIFYDQRACGQSSIEVDSATMNLDGFIEDIEQLRVQLNLGKINLMGHSWGGLLAMKYAIKYDDVINHLILSNSMAPSTEDWQAENLEVSNRTSKEDQRRLQAIASSGGLRSDDPIPYVKQLMTLSYKPQMYDTTNLSKLELYIPDDYMTRSGVFSLLSPDLRTFDLYDDLNKIESPTTIIFGETEAANVLHADKMTAAFPDASLEVIDRAGHFPFVENNRAYLKLIRKRLD